jgi:hypothetical protein
MLSFNSVANDFFIKKQMNTRSPSVRLRISYLRLK